MYLISLAQFFKGITSKMMFYVRLPFDHEFYTHTIFTASFVLSYYDLLYQYTQMKDNVSTSHTPCLYYLLTNVKCMHSILQVLRKKEHN